MGQDFSRIASSNRSIGGPSSSSLTIEILRSSDVAVATTAGENAHTFIEGSQTKFPDEDAILPPVFPPLRQEPCQ